MTGLTVNDAARKDVVSLLLDLVAIPSVSPMSNRPVIDYALTHLHPALWNLNLHAYTDPAGVEKVNLVAQTHGGQSAGQPAELALVCHTDTVPFDPAWEEAVAPKVRDGNLYGRGSCDVKGFLACILAAVSRIDLARLSKPLAVVLTSDEETGCTGAKFLANRQSFRARHTLIGEPTGLRPVTAGKGYALGEILVRGREAHSAFPARGRSAIYDAARVVVALDAVARKLARRVNGDFDPPFTTLNVGMIRGGTAKNIVPGECRLTVEWRPIPGQDASWPAALVQKELDRLASRFPGLDARLEVQRLDPAFCPSATRGLADLIESLTGHPSTTVAFGTEAAHLSPLTSEAVVFGPGDMGTAHKTGEHVPTGELSACVSHLETIVMRLCGQNGT